MKSIFAWNGFTRFLFDGCLYEVLLFFRNADLRATLELLKTLKRRVQGDRHSSGESAKFLPPCQYTHCGENFGFLFVLFVGKSCKVMEGTCATA